MENNSQSVDSGEQAFRNLHPDVNFDRPQNSSNPEINVDTKATELYPAGSAVTTPDFPEQPGTIGGYMVGVNYGAIAEKKPEKDLHKEAIDLNDKRNEGYTGTHFSKEGQNALGAHDAISKIAKENAQLEEQNRMLLERLDKMQATLDKLAGNTSTYEQDPALAAALDPNRVKPINPLEQAQAPLIKDINAKQAEFAKQVQLEDIKNNPLNPLHASNVPAIPETTPTNTSEAEAQAEKDRTERDRKKKLLIASLIGGGAGLTAAALGGAAIATPVYATLGIAGIAGFGVKFFGERARIALQPKIDAATGEEKARLERKKEKWSKVLKWTDRAMAFIGGASFGYMAGSLVSKVFFGGTGLLNSAPTGSGYHPANPGGEPNPRGGEGGTSTGHQPIESGQPFDSGLVKDGRVVLPGDPSNGNLATGPVGNLPGGELNPNNAIGGQSDIGWWKLNQYLNANHIKVSDLQAAGGDIHRMGYALQVDPTQTLPDLLNKFGGSSVLGQNASLGSTQIIR